jgi:hypothetical protein
MHYEEFEDTKGVIRIRERKENKYTTDTNVIFQARR